MPRPLSAAVVVVTGASSGIGRATALAFARRGAAVVVAARRREALREVADQCMDLGGMAVSVATDVTEAAAVQHLARTAIERFGRIDVWVNNAAVALFGRLEEAPLEAIRRVLDTNLLGYIHGARAVVPYFREQGEGVLINVSSIVGVTGQPLAAPYAISKFGIRGLTESLRMELIDAPDIHVCSVLPPSVDTPLFHQAANYSRRAVRAMPPVYPAEEVARAIVACAEEPEHEVLVGGAARLAAALHALAPGPFQQMYARAVERSHFQDVPAPLTEGNLFEPMPGWAMVSGGWKQAPAPGRRLVPALLVGVALLVPAALLWQRAQRSVRTPRLSALRR